MSFFRRAGALIARFFESSADPVAVANEFKLYSKDAAGVTQLFGRSDDGTVHQITPPGAASASASASNVLTFRPGGADVGPIVFNDFNALYAQLVSLRAVTVDSGLFTIVFDDSLASAVIPDAGTYDMVRTSWMGGTVEGPTNVGFAVGVTGTVITNLLAITGCRIVNTNGDAAAPPIRLGDFQTLYLDRALIENGDEVNAVIYVESDGEVTIHMGDESGVSGTPAQPAIVLASSAFLTLHMNGATSALTGAGAVVEEAAGSALAVFINASSARYVLQTTITNPPQIRLNAAHGWFPIDPNGIVTADAGALLSGAGGGSDIYRNTDGATTWELVPVTPVPPESVGTSWITTINAVSAAPGTPSEWQAFEPPLLPWLAGDVVTIDLQIQSPNDLSLFFAQAGVLITGSPDIDVNSATPWTGRFTFVVISGTEARVFGVMFSDPTGVIMETNSPTPATTFTFDPSVAIQFMLANSVEATAYVGTLEARLSRGATVSAVT